VDTVRGEKISTTNKHIGIQKRTTKMLVLFGVVVATIITITALGSFKEQLKKDFHAHLLSVAEIQKLRVKTFVERSKERLALVASRTQLRISLQAYQQKHSQEHLNRMLKDVQDAQNSMPDFTEISVLNREGRVVVSTLPDRVGGMKRHFEFLPASPSKSRTGS